MSDVKECSNFILLHVTIQFSQHHLLKRLEYYQAHSIRPPSVDTQTRQRYHKNRKLHANITDGYRCKNPTQNTSKKKGIQGGEQKRGTL